MTTPTEPASSDVLLLWSKPGGGVDNQGAEQLPGGGVNLRESVVMVEWRDDVSMVTDPLASPMYPMHVTVWVPDALPCTTEVYGGGGVFPREVDEDLLKLK